MTPQELKNSILQLAIQGKLVEQRPEEGTAEELYQQIQAEKQKLIREGKIKKEKPLPEITEEEKPFDIPDGWKWVRLGDYSQKITDQVASGSFASLRANVPSLKEPDYAIMVKTADFSNGFTRNLTYTDRHGYEFLENSNLFGGELILSNIGSIGKCFIVPKLEKKMTLAPNSVMVRLIFDEQRDYLYQFILSPQGYQELVGITSGTAMKKFNKTDLKQILVPVPPLAEQKRIVAKIEELQPLIDRYEKAWTRLEEFNKRFPDDLQKSILQLAIQGKLVEQRPEEGTGEELYQRISHYSEKYKPSKHELDFSSMEFDVPESWKMLELNQIFDFVDYRGKTPNKIIEGVFLITASNVKQGYMDYTRKEYISFEEYKTRMSRGVTHKGDLLFTTEAPMGNAAICDLDLCSCGQRIITFQEYEPNYIIPKLFMYFIISPQFQAELLANCTGTTAKGIKAEKLKHFRIPLPPLAEQKRIVSKLEELLPLCQKLAVC